MRNRYQEERNRQSGNRGDYRPGTDPMRDDRSRHSADYGREPSRSSDDDDREWRSDPDPRDFDRDEQMAGGPDGWEDFGGRERESRTWRENEGPGDRSRNSGGQGNSGYYGSQGRFSGGGQYAASQYRGSDVGAGQRGSSHFDSGHYSGPYGGGQYGGSQSGSGHFGSRPFGGSPQYPGGQFGGGQSRSRESGWGSTPMSGSNRYRMGLGHSGKGPKGYTRSDDRIRDDISDALMADDDIDASEIEVEVRQGEVILRGLVDSRNAKRAAEDLAESIQGVRNVQNSLRVQSGEMNGGAASSSNMSPSGSSSNMTPGGSPASGPDSNRPRSTDTGKNRS